MIYTFCKLEGKSSDFFYIPDFDQIKIAYVLKTYEPSKETECVIDVFRLIEYWTDHYPDFETIFSHCISHEAIHDILRHEIGSDESIYFDEICHNLFFNDKLGVHKWGCGL